MLRRKKRNQYCNNMSGEERNKLVEMGLRYNDVVLDEEVIEKVIHVVDVVTRNGDSSTFKTLRYEK